MNLESIGNEITRRMKQSKEFPYKTGNLKFNATSGNLIDENTYEIKFDGNIAPYVSALEEGSKPHNIPNAFGKGYDFGIGGRFDGFFHSGSNKHKGFIKNDMMNIVLDFFKELGGKVK